MNDQDIPFLTDLRKELLRAIADGNSSGQSRGGRSASRWLRNAGLVAASLILIGVSGALWLHFHSSSSPSRGVLSQIGLPNGVPFPNAKRVSLASASEAVPFVLYRPQDALASDQSVVRVWVTPNGAAAPQAAIEYKSGIRVHILPQQFQDVLAAYQGVIEETKIGSVETINGFPALILPGNIPGYAPTIDTVIRGVEVQIVGGPHDFSVADMLRVAASIRAAEAKAGND